MSLRGLLVLGLLVSATTAERFAYYGMRSVLAIDFRAEGTDLASMGRTFMVMQWLLVVGTLAGGAASLAVGPRATAAAGALLTVVGHFALPDASLLAGAGLVAFGAGVFRPCPFAAAAEVFATEDGPQLAPNPLRFAGMTAFACAIYGAIHAGAAFATMLIPWLRSAHGRTLTHGIHEASALLTAILAGAAAVLGLLARPSPGRALQGAGPYRRGPAPAAPALGFSSAGLTGVAILAAPAVLFMAGEAFAQPPMELMHDSASRAWLFMINPIVVVLASMALFGVAIAAVLTRWAQPPLLLYAVGLIAFGIGLVPIGVASAGGEAAGLSYAAGALITGCGEAALAAIGIAYVALAVRGRGRTLAVAVWLCVMTGVGSFVAPLAVIEARTLLTLVVAVMCLGGGGMLLAFARRMHQVFFDPLPIAPKATDALPASSSPIP